MKKVLVFFVIILLTCSLTCCQEKKAAAPIAVVEETPDQNDSTVYGVCVARSDFRFKVVTTMEDTLDIAINDAESDNCTHIAGGLMKGDRLAVTLHGADRNLMADRVVNLTSLLGRWKSLDNDFLLTDDGDVECYNQQVSKQWNSWKILNGQLLLNRDTFDVVSLDGDTMELENNYGIFVFTRKND